MCACVCSGRTEPEMVTGIVSSVVGWQLLFLFFGLSPAFPARACFCLLHRRLQRVSTQGGVVNQRASCVWSLDSLCHTRGVRTFTAAVTHHRQAGASTCTEALSTVSRRWQQPGCPSWTARYAWGGLSTPQNITQPLKGRTR